MIHPDDASLMAEYLQSLTLPTESLFARWIGKDGVTHWMESRIVQVHDAEGQLIAVEGITRDITERKQIEEQLRESEEKYRQIAENTSDGMMILGADNKVQYVSPAYTRQLGYSDVEESKRTSDEIYLLIHPDDRDVVFANIFGAIKSQTSNLTYTYRAQHRDGHYIWREDNAKFNYDSAGNYAGAYVVCRDVTERKQMDEQLRESEDKHRAFIEQSSEGIILINEQGNIIEWNHAREVLTGLKREDVLGKPYWDMRFQLSPPEIRTPDSLQRFKLNTLEMLRTGQSPVLNHVFEGHLVTITGENKFVEQVSFSVKTEKGYCIGSVMRDITERKQVEEALRLQSAALEAAASAILITDCDGIIEWANSAFITLTGYALSEAIGKNPRELIRSGMQDDVFYKNLWSLILSGQVWRGEIINRRKDKSLYTEEMTITPLHNEFGEIKHFIAIKQDITERKKNEAELQRHANEFAALYETSSALSLQNNLSNLLQIVVESGITLLNAPSGGVYLYDSVSNELEMAITLGIKATVAMRIPLGQGLAGRVAQNREAIFVDDYRFWEGRLPIASNTGYPFTAMLGVPMLYSGELVGVLLAREISENGRKFTEADVRLLSLFAAQAAGAIHNARSNEEITRRVSELEAVNTISIALRSARTQDEMLPRFLKETLETFGTESGALWLYDDLSDTLHCTLAQGWMSQLGDAVLKRGAGIVGTTFASGEPHLSEEFVTDPLLYEEYRPRFPKGWGGVCVPIQTNQEIVGVLFVAVAHPRHITQTETQLLNTLAELAGNTIHRMSLYEQTVSRLQRLSALRSVDVAISSSFDLSMTLGIISTQLENQLGADALDVLLYNSLTQTFTCVAQSGFNHKVIGTLRLGEGLAGKVIIERRTISEFNLQTLERVSKADGFVAYHGVPLIANGQLKGVLEIYHRKLIKFDEEWINFFETLGGQTAIAIDRITLFESLQRSNFELQLAYDATIEGWSRALDLRDSETEGHSLRVTEMTLRLARAMGVSEADIVHIRRGSLLHDIGKLGISDAILHKSSALSEDEWHIMKQHPQYAYDMLSPIDYLRPALDIPYCHHEKWNGMGYPRGLKGEDIPLAARIFELADVWDALISNRPYRKGWSVEQVRQYIREQSGKYFDPQIVEVFLQNENIADV